jgi:hypothetical protein
MPTRPTACLVIASLLTVTLGAQTPPPLTVKDVEALQSSTNDPGGDYFGGTPERLRTLLDAMAADSSLLSPMSLFMAANTAMRLGRVADAAFFLYAGQIRAAFDFDRYDISSRANGNNAVTYLGFLNQTTGEAVNPAIQREPKLFASVIERIEKWNVVPADNAPYPEFEEAKGFKMKREEWTAHARAVKEDFLDRFGRRYATLFNNPEFFAAHMIVQDANPLDEDPKAEARVQAALEKMEEIEARLFPGQPAGPQRRRAPEDELAAIEREAELVDTLPEPAAAEDMPMRVGGKIPMPKKIKHVEPVFPKGLRGSIVIELTINRDGRVDRFNVLSGEFGLFPAAEAAIREWVFEPVRVDGKAVAVLQTFSFTAK